jgi:hypothetical protein
MGQERENYQQELFEYLSNELDVITLQSQMHDIETIVLNMNQQTNQEDKEEFAIGFAEWCDETSTQVSKGEWANWLPDAKNCFSTKELLEIYKKERGL